LDLIFTLYSTHKITGIKYRISITLSKVHTIPYE